MNTEWIIAVALGIGLSASAGFRVFVPLLVAAVAGKTGILPLTDSFIWMSSWASIICFGTATILEILAYYIPVVDNLLDAVNTPLAIAGGTLLATSVLPGDHELLKWVSGLLIGGTSAGIIHAGTSLLRLASTKTTVGTGNAILSTGEHIAAFGTSISVLFIPVIVGALVLIFLIYLIGKVISLKKNK
jgi:hypothetical protein